MLIYDNVTYFFYNTYFFFTGRCTVSRILFVAKRTIFQISEKVRRTRFFLVRLISLEYAVQRTASKASPRKGLTKITVLCLIDHGFKPIISKCYDTGCPKRCVLLRTKSKSNRCRFVKFWSWDICLYHI